MPRQLSPQMRANAGRGRPPGLPNKVTREIREAARAIIERPDYLASLQRRLDAGSAPHMETLLHHYAYGKPVEMMQIDARLSGHTTVVHKQLVDTVLAAAVTVVAPETPSEAEALQVTDHKADTHE